MIETETRAVWPNQIARPANCDPSLGVSSPCPHCLQRHMRPGYCQALDPVSPGWKGDRSEQDRARKELRAALEKAHGPMPHATKPATPTPKLRALAQAVTLTDPVTDSPEPVTDSQPLGKVRCLICDKPFVAARSDARYCSATCRQRARRIKEAGA